LALAAALLVGCGSSGGDGSDGGPPDAAPGSVVAVEVVDGEVPRPGVEVQLHDLDGSPIASRSTDAGGRVELAPETDAIATVIVGTALHSYYVRPGDLIRLLLGDSAEGTLAYTIPAGPPETTGMLVYAGAQLLDQLATEGDFSGVKDSLELGAIDADDTITVLAAATDMSGVVIGFSHATGARTDATEVTLPPFAPQQTFAVTLAPETLPISAGLPISRGDIAYPTGVGFVDLTTPINNSPFPVPVAFSTDVEVEVVESGDVGGEPRRRVVRKRLALSDGAVTVDMAADGMADPGELRLSTDRGQLLWTAPPAAVEVARFTLVYGAGAPFAEWTLEAPAALGALVLPRDLAGLDAVSVSIELEDFTGFNDYSDYRATPPRHTRHCLPARGELRSVRQSRSL
jgi:hypothetical protein